MSGSNGINAFTISTAALTLPAANANVTALVGSSLWMAVGQIIISSDGTNLGNFQVVSFPGPTSVLLKWLDYPGDSATGTVIASNATFSPAGLLGTFTSPLPVAEGGTNATTVAGALVSLGLPTGFHAGTYIQNGTTPVVVANANVTADSVVVITLKTVGGTVGVQPHVATITVGVGFTVIGTASDTSTYNYLIIG